MGSDVLGVSISGLRVSQSALRTVGHNISNASTEGYSRQRTEVNSLGANAVSAGYLGNGAYVSRIERIVNEFVTGQIRQDTSLYHEMDAYNEHIVQLNDILSNETTGLSKGLHSFFAALQNVSDDPTSSSSRQLLISESENIADRFNTLYSRIDAINDSATQALEGSVSSINALTTTIAELNQAINEATGVSTGTPNDLLDQRDEALRSLSELVSIHVTEQGPQVNVSVGNGQPLVIGTHRTELLLEKNEFNPLQSEIYVSGSTQPVTEMLSGGEIGGLLDVEETVIHPTLSSLGQLALVLGDQFNALQQQGITANNTFGSDIFFDINDSNTAASRVFPSVNNLTNDQITGLTITDTAQLTSSSYRLSIGSSGTTYRIMRLDDNVEVSSGALPVVPGSITFDGLSFDITAGTFSDGDEFLLHPTRHGARDFSAMPLQAADLALGSPVLTDTTSGNLGSATISAGEVLSLTNAAGATPLFGTPGQMSPPLIVKFTTPTSYDVLDNSDPANPVQLTPPIRNQVYVPGIQNHLFTTDDGQTTVVSDGTELGLHGARTDYTVNEYQVENFTFTRTDPDTSATSSQNIFSILNASARATAGLLDNVDGVSAMAFNYVELKDFGVSLSNSLQISLNGENLVEYNGATISTSVPDPTVNSGEDFNDYLVDQINNNATLTGQGIYAVSAYNATDGFHIQVHSTLGDDFDVQLSATAGETIDVNDGINAADVTLTAGGPVTQAVIGGQIDVNLADNITMATAGTGLFNTTVGVASFLGVQANITGTPQAGDTFTINFNENAASDNRNSLLMVDLQQTNTISSSTSDTSVDQTYSESYNRLLETVGIKTSTSTRDREAAEKVLEQTTSLRDSVSGVNLDEEATDLIRFEQLYSANAQVINVARELFDRLINSF